MNTLSKLTFGDTARFLSLIGDVFPGAARRPGKRPTVSLLGSRDLRLGHIDVGSVLDEPSFSRSGREHRSRRRVVSRRRSKGFPNAGVASGDVDGGALEAAIRDVMASPAFGLTADEAQIRKMLQLKEALDQRMGCVVVGPSGCGKSTAVSRESRPLLSPPSRFRLGPQQVLVLDVRTRTSLASTSSRRVWYVGRGFCWTQVDGLARAPGGARQARDDRPDARHELCGKQNH